jgi:hypothetical protein
MSTRTARHILICAFAVSAIACGSTRTGSPDSDAGSSGSDAGAQDPCDQAVVLSCDDSDTCDEVYMTDSADQLRPLCNDPGESTSASRCTLRQCCYHDDGLFGMPSLHCVSESIDPDYRTYCLGHGGTYCER